MPIPVSVVEPPSDNPDPFTFARTVGTWRGGNGDLLTLTSCPDGIDWQAGRSGTDMPPFETLSDPYPNGDGEIPGSTRALARTQIFPLLVHMPRWVDWREIQQRLLRALNPLDGDGTLTIYQPDSSFRVIQGRYVGGAEGQDIQDLSGLWYRKYAVALKSFDPWWTGSPVPTVRFSNVDPPPNFLDTPFLPIKLSASQVIGGNTAVNVGDVPAYPVWTIHGPATTIELTNNTTGETLTVDHSLTLGQSIIVDTRPLRKSVFTGAGANIYADVGPNPSLWSLVRGDNELTIAVTGSTADTVVDLDYVPRFLSA